MYHQTLLKWEGLDICCRSCCYSLHWQDLCSLEMLKPLVAPSLCSTLQPRAFRFLNLLDPLVLVSNCYVACGNVHAHLSAVPAPPIPIAILVLAADLVEAIPIAALLQVSIPVVLS